MNAQAVDLAFSVEAHHVELRHREAELAQRDRVQTHTEQVAEHHRVHAERIAQDARDDAEARRATELYAKSVEQAGLGPSPGPARWALRP